MIPAELSSFVATTGQLFISLKLSWDTSPIMPGVPKALEFNTPFILNQTVVAKSREIQLNHNISYEHPSICDEKSGSHHPICCCTTLHKL